LRKKADPLTPKYVGWLVMEAAFAVAGEFFLY